MTATACDSDSRSDGFPSTRNTLIPTATRTSGCAFSKNSWIAEQPCSVVDSTSWMVTMQLDDGATAATGHLGALPWRYARDTTQLFEKPLVAVI